MRLFLLFLTTLLTAPATIAQEATMEVQGIFGECNPVLAATVDRIQLHREPDLRSATVSVTYRQGSADLDSISLERWQLSWMFAAGQRAN